jgi:hypothetical protein
MGEKKMTDRVHPTGEEKKKQSVLMMRFLEGFLPYYLPLKVPKSFW